jgi:hypothetical protein
MYRLTAYRFLLLNPLNAELNPICHLLALLWAHHILHVSRIRVKRCTVRRDIATTSTCVSAKFRRPRLYTKHNAQERGASQSDIRSVNQSICKSCSQSLVNHFVKCVVGKKQEYLIGEASFISILLFSKMSFVENNFYQRICKDIFINCSPFWLMVTYQVSDISAPLNSSKNRDRCKVVP